MRAPAPDRGLRKFTGIIQAIGTVHASEPRGGDLRLVIGTGALGLDDVARGGASACPACASRRSISANGFAADVSTETLSLTTLGALRAAPP